LHRTHCSNMFRILKHPAIFRLCWQSLISTIICKRTVGWRTLKQTKWVFIFLFCFYFLLLFCFLFYFYLFLFLFCFLLFYFVIFYVCLLRIRKTRETGRNNLLATCFIVIEHEICIKKFIGGVRLHQRRQWLTNCTLMNVS